MRSRLFGGAALLSAVIAFGVIPAAAQAEPHWYKKGILIGSSPVITKTGGVLTLSAGGAGSLADRCIATLGHLQGTRVYLNLPPRSTEEKRLNAHRAPR